MKRVLYVAYFFPPMGGAGVQRSAKFTRYLPRFGWAPTVLTADAAYWMRDETLLEDVAPDCVIHRVPAWGAGVMQRQSGGEVRSAGRIRFLRSLVRFLLVPDTYWGWVLPAWRRGAALIERESFDALVTTSSPDSAHLMGLGLHRRFGLPWIADFRDPWTRRMAYAPATPWHDRLHHRLEREVLLGADHVIVTSEETREDFLSRTPGLAPERVSVVTNGYDESDFEAAEAMRGADPLPTRFEVLHAGQLNPERGIEPYLEALLRLRERRAGGGELPRTRFAGGHYDRDLEAVRRRGLEPWVEFTPNRPHHASIADCLRARVLLLLEQPSERGALILPGKIFEYIRARRPILALVPPQGAAARLIARIGAGLVVDPSDPGAIAQALERLLGSSPARSGVDASPVADWTSIRGFERQALTGALAARLDQIRSKPR